MDHLSTAFQCLGICYALKLSSSFLLQLLRGLQAYIYPLLYKTQNFRTKYGEWGLVTGCTQGIGKEYALGLASKGMDIVLVGRDQKKLDEVQDTIRSNHKVKTKVILADFTNVEVLQIVLDHVHSCDIDLGILGRDIQNIKYFIDPESEKHIFLPRN